MPPSEAILKQGWSKDLVDCVPSIVTAFPVVAANFMKAHPDLWIRPDYSWRSPAFQFSLYEKGRVLKNGIWVLEFPNLKVTDQDGTIKRSHHNVYPAQALDFIVFRGKTPLWPKSNPENAALYSELGRAFNMHGLISGATWKYDWKDEGHVQAAYAIT
jgi:hypothetical protein